jgi:NTP pyrophosphatase (non-canonical NTP hydrolase)
VTHVIKWKHYKWKNCEAQSQINQTLKDVFGEIIIHIKTINEKIRVESKKKYKFEGI